MKILYDVVGDSTFTSDPLVVPGRLEFAQGGIFRLKLTDIQGREGVELYPTLEVGTASYRSAAYLAHNAIAVQFTEEDLDQALSSNFVTKVIYLPDPEFQGDAISGIDTLVSTRLEPGLDPIVEADRRGSILAIIRLGNKDVEMSGSTEFRWWSIATRRLRRWKRNHLWTRRFASERLQQPTEHGRGCNRSTIRNATKWYTDRIGWTSTHSIWCSLQDCKAM